MNINTMVLVLHLKNKISIRKVEQFQQMTLPPAAPDEGVGFVGSKFDLVADEERVEVTGAEGMISPPLSALMRSSFILCTRGYRLLE